MNAKVHPLVAVLVIVATFVALGVWAWGGGQAREIGGPAELLESPSGHLYVQMQNFLLEHDANGQFVKRHKLSELGVERVLGAIGFFRNGDILLRVGPDERTFFDNVRAYLRHRNEKPVQSDSTHSGLHRCTLETGECRPFGTGRIDFNAAFSVFIDPAGNEVYVSDTTRHALRKYSAAGEHLADSEGGYKFPNQLVLHDGRLLVANTNHHEVRIVSPETDSFGREIVAVNVVPPVASRNEQTWPSHFARVGDEWWVNNMRSAMNDGGIYIFDDDWQFKARVDLPAGADPIALLPFNGEVLVSDWKNDRVRRVLVNGIHVGDFASAGLKELVAESVEQRWQYQAIAYFALAALGLLIIGLLIAMLVIESAPDAPESPVEPTIDAPDEMIWFKPDERVVRTMRWTVWLGGVMVVALAPLVIYVIFATDFLLASYDFVLPIVVIATIFVPLLYASQSNMSSAIGLQGQNVTLRDHTGRETTYPASKMSYSENGIAGPDSAVFLGQQQLAIYDRHLLETQVFPRLASATSVSAWEMQKMLIRVRHPQGMATVAVLIGAAVCGVLWALMR